MIGLNQLLDEIDFDGKLEYAGVLAQRALFIYFAIVKRLRSLPAFVTACQNDLTEIPELKSRLPRDVVDHPRRFNDPKSTR